MIDDHLEEGGELDALIDARAQPLLVKWLATQQPSAHGDVGQALIRGADAVCTDWTAYSPSFAQYRYVALITQRRAFALATGMDRVSVCVADAQVAVAIARGGVANGELGTGWVSFALWHGDAGAPDLHFWLRAAYAHARAMAT